VSTVAEVKSATEQLSAQERWELYRWLGESKDVQRLRHDELRREIEIGIEQADRGEMALWDLEETKAEVRRRLNVRMFRRNI
jgi:antitoxin ParD1/3/4